MPCRDNAATNLAMGHFTRAGRALGQVKHRPGKARERPKRRLVRSEGEERELVRDPARTAWVFHAQARRFINTVASARCKEALGALQPFQRFGWERGKPLKRPPRLAAYVHRAEAAVLMTGGWPLKCPNYDPWVSTSCGDFLGNFLGLRRARLAW